MFEKLKDIFFRSTLLHTVQYSEEEKIIRVIEKAKVESSGQGPEEMVFPNCKIIFTEQRIIIAQKILWQDKYKVHYFVWLNSVGKMSQIQKGMIHLSATNENIVATENLIIIIPDDSTYIAKIVITL